MREVGGDYERCDPFKSRVVKCKLEQNTLLLKY